MNRLLIAVIIAVSVLLSTACSNRKISESRIPASIRNPAGTPQEYTGGSDYRLFFAPDSASGFNPDSDLINPSQEELAKEKIRDAIKASFVKALLPIYGVISGNSTGTEPDVFGSVLHSISILQNNLRDELKAIPAADGNQEFWPFEQQIVLVPFKAPARNIFYAAEKVSLNTGEAIRTMGMHPGLSKFDQETTQAIKSLQDATLPALKDPAYLIGMESRLHINPITESKINIKILLGLKPERIPFSQTNDQVKIKEIVIPTAEYQPAVVLEFTIGLSPQSKEPTLVMNFGKFSEYKNGTFVMEDKGQQNTGPCLLGNLPKPNLVAVSFCFKQMNFDLSTTQLSAL
jgi:hypothetical protein